MAVMEPPRRGPRPLGLHLTLAAMRGIAALQSSLTPASPIWSGGWPRSKPAQATARRIAAQLAAGGHRPEAFARAVAAQLGRDDAALLAGIAAYRRHARPAAVPPPPAIWREGASALLDFGGTGRPVLVVPSLVNRANVLDLLPGEEGGSMLRWLVAEGWRPLLLDWGEPGVVERRFTVTDFVAGRLERGLAVAAGLAGGKVAVAGYCMGGLLALAAAQRRPEHVAALALLATPWDFWAPDAAQGRALANAMPALEPLLVATGALPVDALQTLFALLDPFGIAERYRGFAAVQPGSARARRFVALEDWLNDGVALPAAVAREALGEWYGANAPARGAWLVAGQAIDPAAVAVPLFLAIPERDRIVPPASAVALAGARPDARVHRAAGGHIGMVAGGGAEAALWRPLAGWLSAPG